MNLEDLKVKLMQQIEEIRERMQQVYLAGDREKALELSKKLDDLLNLYEKHQK